MVKGLVAQAERWIESDPDEGTRQELRALLDAGDARLADRFAGPLVFGTAGLRGIIGAGETRMNVAVVRRATAGLGAYLLEHVSDARARGVVIGYDGRRKSRTFAEQTAAVLLAAGLRVYLSKGVCPTPVVAFGVLKYEAAAGVMVTASHNPREYNGFKVYAENGAQIISPVDQHIAKGIEEAGPARSIGVANLAEAVDEDRLRYFGEDLDDAYCAAVGDLVPRGTGDRGLSIVYTALHGVGDPLVRRTLAEAGFQRVRSVAEQAKPDGSFPTVAFPNPEEPGAMDLVTALAVREDAALVLANDPDADRLSACVRTQVGAYQQLSGNQVGVLLGHYLMERDQAVGDDSRGQALVITTIVSSPWLGCIAQDLDVAYDETLTGFKWVANCAMTREREHGQRFLFGYEEALGYTIGTVTRDKDGIGAALVLSVLAAQLHAQGRTLLDELERIARRHGLFASKQRSIRFEGADGALQMEAVMQRLRDEAPSALAGFAIEAVTDCQAGTRRANGQSESIALPKSNVMILGLAEGHRVIARPSGTEPKMKLYFDVREQLVDGQSLADAQERADATIERLEAELLQLLGLS
ncbi:MAG: phospho-sugar mutase [Polyangiaceae bacterium]